jgi:STE24 endopeptidase
MIHNPRLYTDFGFTSARPTYIGLLLFSFIYSPVQHVTTFLMNVLSRKFEFEADEFAVKLGYGEELALALITLQKENKGTPISDPAYSAYHHSHPPLLQRLQAIEAATKGKKTE